MASRANRVIPVQGTSEPAKVFDRAANLQGSQIINYRVAPDEKWFVLIGIAPGAPEVSRSPLPLFGEARWGECIARVGALLASWRTRGTAARCVAFPSFSFAPSVCVLCRTSRPDSDTCITFAGWNELLRRFSSNAPACSTDDKIVPFFRCAEARARQGQHAALLC